MFMTNEWDKLPLWGWLLIAIVLLSQSTWLFLNARKQGANPWFWGIWGVIQAPIPLIVYGLVVRKVHRVWFGKR
jgi:hypothetical protein